MTIGSFGRSIIEGDWEAVRRFLSISGIGGYTTEDGLNAMYNDYIRLRTLQKRDGKPYVYRGPDRRKMAGASHVLGTQDSIVLCMEAVARQNFGKLSEDQREVLAQAQANVRKDRTANGYRRGKDRRAKNVA